MDPFTIAAMVSMALGTVGTMSANRSVQKRQDGAMQAERLRQRRIDEERQAAIDANLPKFNAEQQTQDRGDIAGRLEAFLQPEGMAGATGEYLPMNPGAPKEVQDSLASRLAESLSKGRRYATDLSRMSAFGGQALGNNITLGRLGQTTGMLGNDSVQSNNVLGIELNGAQRAGHGARTVADIANGVGSIASLYGMSRPAAKVKPSSHIGSWDGW